MKEKTTKLLVHRYIRKRMTLHHAKVADGEHLEWHYKLREAFRDLWHGMAEPPARPPPPPPEGQPPADPPPLPPFVPRLLTVSRNP